jgi:hypothetical protein
MVENMAGEREKFACGKEEFLTVYRGVRYLKKVCVLAGCIA